MGIRILAPPDPGSMTSWQVDTILIGSAGAEHLERELRRYCQGDIDGRSFLIAGHRGAGKTTMVNQCVQHVQRLPGLPYRPLLVRLHGPNLVREVPVEAQPTPSASEGGPADAKTPAGPQASPQSADAVAIAEAARALQGHDREENSQRRQVQIALQQITLALHRALSDELTKAYRKRVDELSSERVSPRTRQQLYERAAQLALELDQYTTPDRLRQFWAAADCLQTGVLPSARQDQGMRELVALSAACQAYGRVSGTFAKAEVKQSIQSTQTTALATAKEGLDVISPLLSLLLGGITGTAAIASQTPAVSSTAAGVLAAVGSAAVFKFTASRSRTRTYSSDLTFVPDMRLDTLDRVLPTLIDRVVGIGLAPVFVIDELDKVENLYDQLESIVRHLKTIVAERAFFCFLTDRSYFERVVNVDVRDPYPKHFTYFTDRVFVSFQPADLHRYLGELLKAEHRLQAPPAAAAAAENESPPPGASESVASDDDLDLDVLKYVLLRRSEMHAVRLRRQILSWSRNNQTDSQGQPVETVLFPPGVVRSLMRYRFDLLIQFAIELILHRPPIANRLRDDPAFARLVYDALYYPVRLLSQTSNAAATLQNQPAGLAAWALDLSDQSAFDAYLVERMSSDPDAAGAKPLPSALRPIDSTFLLEQLRALAEMLSDPYALLDELAEARKSGFAGASEAVLSAIPFNPDGGPLLRARLGASHVYEWRYDHDWNARR
jgi:hypothetical protein